MELVVDNKKKNMLHKAAARSGEPSRVLLFIARILAAAGVILCCYVLFRLLASHFGYAISNGRNASGIIISASVVIVPCLVLSVCLRAAALTVAGSGNQMRVDETLLVFEDKLQYSFRMKHQTTSSERKVVTIHFSEIKDAVFDSITQSITLSGEFLSEYYADYTNGECVDSSKLNRFVIYDYFSPSLKKVLQTNRVAIRD